MNPAQKTEADSAAGTVPDGASLYLDLLKRVVVNSIYCDPNVSPWDPPVYDEAKRGEGRDWPRDAHTMVGLRRLNNLQECVESVLKNNIPGDIIETGVWRGGASIFLRAVMKAHQVTDRILWVADSFEGLPPPKSDQYPDDAGDPHHTFDFLRVNLETVQANFARYGLLDNQVRFLKGWFCDTLAKCPAKQFSLLRLDGDMYESTMDALTALYPRLSRGGFVVVDDYKAVPACAKAVEAYRARHGITEPIIEIDWAGVFWKKESV